MAFMTSVIWNFVCKKKKKNNFFFFVSLMKNKNEFLFTSLTSILNFVLKQTRGCSDLVPPKIKQAVYCFKKKKKKVATRGFPMKSPSQSYWLGRWDLKICLHGFTWLIFFNKVHASMIWTHLLNKATKNEHWGERRRYQTSIDKNVHASISNSTLYTNK